MLNFHSRVFNRDHQLISHVAIAPRQILEINCTGLTMQELDTFHKTIILDYLSYCEEYNIPVDYPNGFKHPLENGQLEIVLQIERKFKIKFFEKALPVIGHTSNILAVLSLAFISYLAMQLTIGTDFKSKVLSLGGSLYSLLITFLIYIFSGASKGLAGIGRNIDNWLIRRSKNLLVSYEERMPLTLGSNARPVILIEEKQANSMTATILKNTVAGGMVLANAALNSVTTYQELKGLGERAAVTEGHYVQEAVTATTFILITAAAISEPAFQLEFIKKAITALINKCQKQANKQHSGRSVITQLSDT